VRLEKKGKLERRGLLLQEEGVGHATVIMSTESEKKSWESHFSWIEGGGAASQSREHAFLEKETFSGRPSPKEAVSCKKRVLPSKKKNWAAASKAQGAQSFRRVHGRCESRDGSISQLARGGAVATGKDQEKKKAVGMRP